MIDLTDPTQWNLVFRRELTVSVLKLPRQSFVTNARQIFVGIYVPNEPKWYRGGFLTQYVPALPSTQADLFTALTQVGNYRLTCRNYQILELADTAPATSVCTIDFPPYFTECTCEVFERNDI